MKRLQHIICRITKGYLWRVKDPKSSYWAVICTRCGYEKEI